MTNIKDIIINQKEKMESILEYYDTILNNNENIDVYNMEVLTALEKINNNYDEIQKNFDLIQYQYDIKIKNKTDLMKDRIKNYEIDKKVLDVFGPYMIYYKLILDKEY